MSLRPVLRGVVLGVHLDMCGCSGRVNDVLALRGKRERLDSPSLNKQPGINFHEVFAHTTRWLVVHTIFALAAIRDLKLPSQQCSPRWGKYLLLSTRRLCGENARLCMLSLKRAHESQAGWSLWHQSLAELLEGMKTDSRRVILATILSLCPSLQRRSGGSLASASRIAFLLSLTAAYWLFILSVKIWVGLIIHVKERPLCLSIYLLLHWVVCLFLTSIGFAILDLVYRIILMICYIYTTMHM